MSQFSKLAVLILLMLLALTASSSALQDVSPQIGGGVGGFDGGISILSKAPNVIPPSSCSSAFKFNETCNSQYLGIL